MVTRGTVMVSGWSARLEEVAEGDDGDCVCETGEEIVEGE